MKAKKFGFIVVLAIIFAATISTFAAISTNKFVARAATDGETSVVTLGARNYCSLLDPNNPDTSRVDVSFKDNTWNSAFATTGNVTYSGKVEDVKGNLIATDVVIGAATDGKFRIDFKLPQNDEKKFIIDKNMTFTTNAEGEMPKTISFDTTNIITYAVNAAPQISPLGIITPTAMKWSAKDTTYSGYVGYCAFEYSSNGYDPIADGNQEIKGISATVYDLAGNSSNARMDVNFGKTKRIYMRLTSEDVTQFVVRRRDVFTLSGKAFKFDKSYKFTWAPAGGNTKCEEFDDGIFDKPAEPIAEQLVVSIGGGMWATDLGDGKVQLSMNSTKSGYHTATGVYAGQAEDDKGNKVDLTVEWDASNANKMILKFAKSVEILVLKTTMEFTLPAEITGAPNKIVFAKDVFITYAIGTSKITATDLAELANMKTTTLTLGEGSYATDSNPEQAEARVFVSFNYCSWEGEFAAPTAKETVYSGKVYDKDGKEYTQSVQLTVKSMEDKDQTSESIEKGQFRVYFKFPKTVNPLFIKADTVFTRTDKVDGTPFKIVIDKDYIVTYTLDSEDVLYTPHLVTFEAKDDIYAGSSCYVADDRKITAPSDVQVPEGYRAEWLDEENNVFDFENDTVKSSLTLHLSLVEQVTVTFDSDGGSKVNDRIVDKNGKVAKPNNPVKLSPDEKIACVFDGWYLKNSDTAFDFENTAVTENITLKAKWVMQVVKVTLTFDSDGGTETAPVLVNVNGKATKPADPEKTAGDKKYKFEGWYTEGSETPFDFENTVITEDITLIARWSEVNTAEGSGCFGSITTQSSLIYAFIALAAAIFVSVRKKA